MRMTECWRGWVARFHLEGKGIWRSEFAGGDCVTLAPALPASWDLLPRCPPTAEGSASSLLQSRKQGIQRNVPSPVQGQLRKPITWARGSRHPTGASGPWGPGRPRSAPGTGKNETLHFFSADFFCTRSRPSFLSLFPAETVKWSHESGKIMSTTGEQTKWLFCKRLPPLVSSPSPLEDL